MRYIETVIKVEVKDDGTPMDEVVYFVQAEAEKVAKATRRFMDVGNAHAWTSRHEQVTG
jgi:hypothetical protein